MTLIILILLVSSDDGIRRTCHIESGRRGQAHALDRAAASMIEAAAAFCEFRVPLRGSVSQLFKLMVYVPHSSTWSSVPSALLAVRTELSSLFPKESDSGE